MSGLTQEKIAEFVPKLMGKLQQRGPSEKRGVGDYFPENVIAHIVAQITETEAPDTDNYAKYRIWRNKYYTPLVSRAMILFGYEVYSQRIDDTMGHSEKRASSIGYQINLAKGFTCHVVNSVFDQENRPIFLRMIGPQWSVEANWSALVSGRKDQYLHGSKILYEGGMYQHKKNILPCGWMERITWHNNSDVRFAENGADSIYALSDKPINGQPPAAFCNLLQKSLAIPTKNEWMPYLWTEAHICDRPMIYPIEKNTGMYGWKIRLDAKKWKMLIEQSLQKQILTI